jgi:hypothetical protein
LLKVSGEFFSIEVQTKAGIQVGHEIDEEV